MKLKVHSSVLANNKETIKRILINVCKSTVLCHKEPWLHLGDDNRLSQISKILRGATTIIRSLCHLQHLNNVFHFQGMLQQAN